MVPIQILNFLIPRAVDATHVLESLTKFSLPGNPSATHTNRYPFGSFLLFFVAVCLAVCRGSPSRRLDTPIAPPTRPSTEDYHATPIVHVAHGAPHGVSVSSAVHTDELYAFQYIPDYFSEVDGWKFYNPEVLCVCFACLLFLFFIAPRRA